MSAPESSFKIKGRVAVVTGGSGILGGEIARGFLEAGAHVVLLSRSPENLQAQLENLKKISDHVTAMPCNVLDRSALRQINSAIVDQFGAIDILVNAAGGHIPGAVIGDDQSVFDMEIDAFRAVLDLNLMGTVLPALEFGRTMKKQGAGSIINISSMASDRAITRAVGYSAAKAAVDNFTKWMAVEMSRKYTSAIRVNAIAPGFFLTNQNKRLLTGADGAYTERAKTIMKMTPFDRFGEPQELIGIALWLASDASRFVTGAIIPVDGGFSAFSGV